MEMYGKLEDLKELLDVDSNTTVFYEQITNDEEDYTSPKADHFTELYQDYTEVLGQEDLPQDDIAEITDQFTQICAHIINYINDEYNTDIEVESIMDESHNLPGITKALYYFFIIEFYNNILSILKNYINENSQTIYNEFSELNDKKDIMTNYYKKSLSKEMSVIASNIYDITDFIFTKIDGSTALIYCDKENLPAQVLRKLLDENNMSDEFITTIADIYKKNVNLRSRICFEIVFAIKSGEIKDKYTLPEASATDN